MVDEAARSLGKKSAAKRLANMTADEVSEQMQKLAKLRAKKLTKAKRSEIARLGGIARQRKAKQAKELGEP